MSEGVQLVDPAGSENWDARIQEFEGATFFHSLAWLNVLVKAYGYAPSYVLAGPAKQPRGVLPLVEVNSWLTGRRGVSLPFTDECQPLLSAGHQGEFECIWNSVLAHGRTRKWRYVECRGGGDHFPSGSAAVSFYGHKLDLIPGESALFEGLNSSVRRAIRKAEKSSLSLAVDTTGRDLKLFYELLCLTRKKHGLPPQPFSFFRRISKEILAVNRGCIVSARLNGRPVAASMYFYAGRSVIYKYGASDERLQDLRGSNLVMWEAIRWFIQKGFQNLDFGRTSLTNEGLRRFKLGWGTREKRIDYFRFNFRTNQFVKTPDEAEGWHNAVFRMLPLRLSRLAGEILYRHVA